MKNVIKTTFFLFLGAILAASLLYPTVTLRAVSTADLGIENPGILPSNPFYFFKEWTRDLRRAFTFKTINRAQLELVILNEQAGEISKLLDINSSNMEVLTDAVYRYQQSLENLRNYLNSTDNSLDSLSSYLIKHIQLLDNLPFSADEVADRAAGLLAFSFENFDTPNSFRLRANLIAGSNNQPLSDLRVAEVLTRMESYLSPQSRLQIAGVKEGLLLSFAAKLKLGLLPDDFAFLPGNHIVRLRAIDDLKIKIADPELRSLINVFRQKVTQSAEKSLTDKQISFVIEEAKKINSILKNSSNQAVFYLEQADSFYQDRQLAGALGQATMALAAASKALSDQTLTGGAFSFYSNELAFLRFEYDQLLGLFATGENIKIINETEKRIVNLADFLQKNKINNHSSKVEEEIIIIKLLLSKIHYSL